MRSTFTTRDLLLRVGGLAVVDAVAIYFAYNLIQNGIPIAAIALAVVTLMVNWIYLDERLFPIRWLTPGLLMMILMVIYPLVFSIYIALTNYSDGHLLSRAQVVDQLSSQYYAPTNAQTYKWTAYIRSDKVNADTSKSPVQPSDFKVVFQDPSGKYFLGSTDQELAPFEAPGGKLPPTIDNYQQLTSIDSLKYLGTLTKISVKGGDNLVRISGLGGASEQLRRYTYDDASGVLTDHQSGKKYTAVEGTFTDDTGKALENTPGFTTVVGLQNYTRVATDPNIQRPFFGVFLWTILFAFFSVALTFVVGLGLAIVLNDPKLPLRSMFRSITIIPYTIPAVISVLIWVGLLNPIYGQFSIMLKTLFGGAPPWFSDGTWAKIGILFVNTWLGFPYMMLLCLGALQGIPTDMYEAANIDGASRWRQFSSLTLPLLLVAVMPLLIGSFAFNFNNFGVIELYNQGGPPIAGVSTPAGQTDILISYTYRLAFGGGQGADYGLASAISLFIFTLVALMTALNFRFTRQLEELT